VLAEILWWHWVVLGIVLMLTELAVPAFFLVWFGLSAVAVGIVLAVLPTLSLTWQVIVWIAGSIVMIWLWFKIFKPGLFRSRSGLSKGSLIGEIGLVTRDIRPYEKGQLRFQKPILGSEVWEAMSEEEIRMGERVKVLDVEGNILKVARP